MRSILVAVFVAVTFPATVVSVFAQGTTFTYQGQLSANGQPANGSYDLQFNLFDASGGGSVIGSTNTFDDIVVSNGLFTVILNPGAGVFDGSQRWLEIRVRTGASVGAYTNLTPRQEITSAPYAIRAANVANGAITSASLANGAVTASKIAPGAISQLGASDGSPTNAVQVNATGLVGIGTGTNTPAAGLQIAAGATFLSPVALFEVADGTGVFTNLDGAGYINTAIKSNLLALVGSRDNAVNLIDISNPALPVVLSQIVNGVGGFTNLEQTTGVVFGNNVLAIVGSMSDAVTLVSVTNPSNPVKLAELKDGVSPWNDLDGATSVEISTNNIMAITASGDNAVTLVDISNPGSPQQRVVLKQGQFGYTNLFGAADVAISGNLMAVSSIVSNSVTLVDITDAASPVKRAELIDGVNGFDGLAFPISVAMSGNLLAIVGALDYTVTLVDVSNPASPVRLGVITGFESLFSGAAYPVGVAFSGNQIAVSGNGVALFDITTPSVPRMLALAGHGEGGLNYVRAVYSIVFAGTNLVVPSDDGALTILGFTNAQAGLLVAGWVGIGTTLPTAPLTVVGNVVVRNADQFTASARQVQFGSSTASGDMATAFGAGNEASGTNSTAAGGFNVASGENSFAAGTRSRASGFSAVAMGEETIASGYDSVAFGGYTIADGGYAMSFGYNAAASNTAATAFGYFTKAGGFAATAAGQLSEANGFAAFGLGNYANASGDFSAALNDHNNATGTSSTALGQQNTASGTASVVMGRLSTAAGNYSLAAGINAQASHSNTFVWADGSGGSFTSTASNQFLIRATGGVGIGTTAPAARLHVAGNSIFAGASVLTGPSSLGGLTTLAAVTNAPAANATLTATSSYMILNPAAAVTLNGTTAIADGPSTGTLLILRGVSDVNTVTINDAANTALGANRILGLNDSLTLFYNGDLWVEIAYANN